MTRKMKLEEFSEASGLDEVDIIMLANAGHFKLGNSLVDFDEAAHFFSTVAKRLESRADAPKDPSTQGHVYFAWQAAAGMVKIGYSKNPDKRVKALQTGSPESVEIVFSIPGTMAQEKRLHRLLGSDRHRNEWFKPTEKMSEIANDVQQIGLKRALEKHERAMGWVVYK